jgi:2-polyprenyl-3-methyl-5-hydroxy-6-metoxy-1,4-benzoquinol methylase
VELESTACPNGCAPSDHLVLEGEDRLHGVPGRFSVVQCAFCGLMRTNPRPTPASIHTYYPEDYAPYQSQDASDAGASQGSRLKRLFASALCLQSRVPPPVATGHLLEIGCASGAYLEQMRSAGWSAEGIEFSGDAAARARARGFRVQTATVESAQAPQQPVDLVAAWMVLEHLHEPVEALRRIRQWVRPDGYLIASVPDAGSLERRLFGDRWYALQLPTHLYHYTPRTLATVLHSAGWQLCRVRWQKNANNLLWSLEYLVNDRRWKRMTRAAAWLRGSPRAGKLRLLLGWILGILRQSGRIEIWAKPLAPPRHEQH